MKKHTLALTAGIALLTFAACKKSNNDNNPSSALVGTWNFHEQIVDSNNNGKIDATDPVTNEDSSTVALQFNSNGTGDQSTFGFKSPFAWKLDNGSIQITDSLTVINYIITAQSATSITVEDTTQVPVQWMIFNKQ